MLQHRELSVAAGVSGWGEVFLGEAEVSWGERGTGWVRDERLIWRRDPNSKGAIGAIIRPTAETAFGVCCIYLYICVYTAAADKSSFADVIECIRRTRFRTGRADRTPTGLRSPETTPFWNAWRRAAGDTRDRRGRANEDDRARCCAPTLHNIIIIPSIRRGEYGLVRAGY